MKKVITILDCLMAIMFFISGIALFGSKGGVGSFTIFCFVVSFIYVCIRFKGSDDYGVGNIADDYHVDDE